MAKNIKRIAFSDRQIFTLIELYQENDCLWNIKSSEYKNNIKRKAAVSNIAEKMGLTEDIVKKKISSLRATYLMEKKKRYDSQRTGTSTDDLYSPTIPWFGHMSFLNDVIIARKTTSNLDSKEIENGEGEAINIIEESQINMDNAISGPSGSKIAPTIQEPLNAPLVHTLKPPPVKRKKCSSAATSIETSTEKTIDDAIKKLSNIADQDIFDNFGTLIASQLRSIPMEDALQLQMDISQLVNNKLLQINRNKNKTTSLSSSPSRPSTSRSDYTDYTYKYTSEDTQDEAQLSENDNTFEGYNDIGESGDIVGRALRGIYLLND